MHEKGRYRRLKRLEVLGRAGFIQQERYYGLCPGILRRNYGALYSRSVSVHTETVAYRQHKDNNPYEYWIKKGDLIALDGKYINFDRFLDHATELDETYRIEQIGFDQWGSQTIINRLEDRWEVIPLGQGTKTMTQVINDFENLLVDERIIIAENECFRFMAKNCIAVYDEMLGVKYSKKKSKFKIDGIIAMLMGLLLCIEENGIEHYNPVEYLDAM